MKLISPVSYKEWKSMHFLMPQTAIDIRQRKNVKVPPGFKGVAGMRGSLSVSGRSVYLCNNSKTERSPANGVRSMDAQKSDGLIVAMKPVKADGAKESANQQLPEVKHAGNKRLSRTWDMN